MSRVLALTPLEILLRFLDALLPFLAETEPAHATEERFHEVLIKHSEG